MTAVIIARGAAIIAVMATAAIAAVIYIFTVAGAATA